MLKELIERFADRTELPIEVEEIAQAIIELGVQDEIHFVDVDADPSKIHGAFVRFTYRPQMYGDPVFVTHIPYNKNEPLEQQRVVCAKELIHIFDDNIEETDTEDEVPEFLDKLLGPLTTDDFGVADYMAAKDKFALYQCLPLLFPRAALQVARAAIENKDRTLEEIAEWAKLPRNIVDFMLKPEWEELNGKLTDV